MHNYKISHDQNKVKLKVKISPSHLLTLELRRSFKCEVVVITWQCRQKVKKKN